MPHGDNDPFFTQQRHDVYAQVPQRMTTTNVAQDWTWLGAGPSQQQKQQWSQDRLTVMNGGSLQVVGPAFNGDPSDQLMQQMMHAFTPVQASTSLPKLEKTIERVTGTKNKSAATEDKSAAPVIKHRAMQARANRSIEL